MLLPDAFRYRVAIAAVDREGLLRFAVIPVARYERLAMSICRKAPVSRSDRWQPGLYEQRAGHGRGLNDVAEPTIQEPTDATRPESIASRLLVGAALMSRDRLRHAYASHPGSPSARRHRSSRRRPNPSPTAPRPPRHTLQVRALPAWRAPTKTIVSPNEQNRGPDSAALGTDDLPASARGGRVRGTAGDVKEHLRFRSTWSSRSSTSLALSRVSPPPSAMRASTLRPRRAWAPPTTSSCTSSCRIPRL